jgi:hypothetical protein
MRAISRAVDQHHLLWLPPAVLAMQAAQQAAEPAMRPWQRQPAHRHGDNPAAALEAQEPSLEGGERLIEQERRPDHTGSMAGLEHEANFSNIVDS